MTARNVGGAAWRRSSKLTTPTPHSTTTAPTLPNIPHEQHLPVFDTLQDLDDALYISQTDLQDSTLLILHNTLKEDRYWMA